MNFRPHELMESRAKTAAAQFVPLAAFSLEALGNGLIHQTFKVGYGPGQKAIVLQSINRSVFPRPEDILHNYNELYQFLLKKNGVPVIPAPLPAGKSGWIWTDAEGDCWRASEYIDGSYSPATAADEDSAYTVAKCFAAFTASLTQLDNSRLRIILPGFHDLSSRYQQFETAITQASIERLMKSTHIIAELRERKSLVELYEMIRDCPDFPFRVMHHDCKIGNILFDAGSGKVICPVDLDTVMPGKFFSDPGDMIRTMACSLDEKATHWEDLRIKPSYYDAILTGYVEGMGNIFSDLEKAHIHDSGPIMIYMQAIRFLTDFLAGDHYYKIDYPEQNLNRALNQLVLLESLEDFLSKNQ